MIFLLLLALTFDEDLQLAKGLFSDSLYWVARDQFLRVVEKYPDSPNVDEAAFWATECMFRLAQYQKCIEEWKRFIEDYPFSDYIPKAYLRIGESYYYLGDKEAARRYFTEATKHGESDAYYWLGDMQLDDSNYVAALEMLDKVKPSSPYYEYVLYDKAYAWYRLKNYESCLDLVKEFRSKYPSSSLIPDILALTVRAYMGLNKYREARSTLDSLVISTPRDAFTKGSLYLELGDTVTALNILSEVKGDSEYTPRALLVVGDIYLSRGDDTSAIEIYKRLLDYPNLQQVARERLGRIYYLRGEYKRAIDYLKPVTSYDGRLLLAHTYFANNELHEAYKIYSELSNKYGAIEPLYWAAYSAFKLGKSDVALTLFNKLLDKGAADYLPKVYMVLGELYFENGDYVQAADYYAKAQKFPELKERALLGEVTALLMAQNVKRAYERAQVLVKEYPSPDAYRKLAEAAYLTGKLNEAAEYYLKASQAWDIYQAGRIYYELGDYSNAITVLQHFTQQYPAHEVAATASYMLGWAYKRKGNPTKAIEVWNTLIHDYPSDTIVYHTNIALGDAYFDRGEYKDALNAYERALKLANVGATKVLTAIRGILHATIKLRGVKAAFRVARDLATQYSGRDWCDAIWLTMGELADLEGEPRYAINAYGRVKHTRYVPEALYGLALIYEKMGKLQTAMDYLQRIVNEYPNSNKVTAAYYEMTKLYMMQNKYETAMTVANKLLSLYPDAPEVPYVKLLVAKIHYEQGNYNEALELLKTLNLLEGKLIEAQIYLKQNKLDKAESVVLQVIAGNDITLKPEARYWLGEIYYKRGDKSHAMEEFLKVKYLYGDNSWVTPALFRAAEIAEELGDSNKAKELYRKVIERGDKPDLIKQAKQRLRRL